MSRKRGRHAAKSGRYGEDTVESLMDSNGFPVVDFANYDQSTPCAVRQYPSPHPYRPERKHAGKNDFMLFTGTEQIFCQVKMQNSNGTCDEKLAFAFDIARYCLTDTPFQRFALILMGLWWPDNPGIIEWAKRKCQEFMMLADGTRRTVSAEVIVGPKELGAWLRGIPKRTKTTSLFVLTNN